MRMRAQMTGQWTSVFGLLFTLLAEPLPSHATTRTCFNSQSVSLPPSVRNCYRRRHKPPLIVRHSVFATTTFQSALDITLLPYYRRPARLPQKHSMALSGRIDLFKCRRPVVRSPVPQATTNPGQPSQLNDQRARTSLNPFAATVDHAVPFAQGIEQSREQVPQNIRDASPRFSAPHNVPKHSPPGQATPHSSMQIQPSPPVTFPTQAHSCQQCQQHLQFQQPFATPSHVAFTTLNAVSSQHVFFSAHKLS